jgi:hypothetical protein
MSRSSGARWTALVAVTAVVSLSTGVGAAGAQPRSGGSIHGHQFFVGTVNGLESNPAVRVLCPGPANSGRPLGGQTLQVGLPAATATHRGFTGSKAKAIVATLSTATGAASFLAKFTAYGVDAAFPTSLTVPCGGTGVVSFAPRPASSTSKADDVSVTFVNMGADASSAPSPLRPTTPAASPPQCTKSQFRITAATDHVAYPPGRTLTMTSSIKNVSHSSCTIFLGAVAGWSPTFTVTDNGGTVVWDRCWVNDQPGACATVLRSYTLRAGRHYQQQATWDQLSGADGQPPHQVPQGQYTFTTHYRYLTGTATATFDIIVG